MRNKKNEEVRSLIFLSCSRTSGNTFLINNLERNNLHFKFVQLLKVEDLISTKQTEDFYWLLLPNNPTKFMSHDFGEKLEFDLSFFSKCGELRNLRQQRLVLQEMQGLVILHQFQY